MNNKLCDLLSAYRKDCSAQHVLLHAIEEQKVVLHNGQHVGVVLMDLSKEFDAIPHCLILTCLTELYTYGISNDPCEMLRNYLINRMQRVTIC